MPKIQTKRFITGPKPKGLGSIEVAIKVAETLNDALGAMSEFSAEINRFETTNPDAHSFIFKLLEKKKEEFSSKEIPA